MFFVCPVNIPSTERRMETDALRCSSAFFLFQTSSHTHTHAHIYKHTHKGNYHTLLPRACQSTPSLSPQTDTMTDGEGLRDQLNDCQQDYKGRSRNPQTFFPRPRPQFSLPQICEVKLRGAPSALLGILRVDASLSTAKYPLKSYTGYCKMYM